MAAKKAGASRSWKGRLSSESEGNTPDVKKVQVATTVLPEEIHLDWEIKDFRRVLEDLDFPSANYYPEVVKESLGVSNLKLSFTSGEKVVKTHSS
jgi:hypothetical protein